MTAADKTTFALFFGNRGFFPSSLMEGAREEMPRVLRDLGHDTLMMPADATPFGAVETPEQGEKYARWLREHEGEFGGVILCLPNFGDENGAVAALKNAGVPIFIHAYPDDPQQMGPEHRRDAFCGKFSIMDVFYQYGIPFTVRKPQTAAPGGARFAENIRFFDRVCRVTNGMRDFKLGAIGARTTPFKTVRADELALQKAGVTVETFDLAGVISRVKAMDESSEAYNKKVARLQGMSNWDAAPAQALKNIAKLGVVVDEVIEENKLSAIALRCWLELQEELQISPCVLMGEMNERGLPAACEVDIASAVTLHALKLASGEPTACLDWNNNYGEEDEKCILFHCGPVPPALMREKGKIVDHSILANAVGPNRSHGPNVGRMKAFDFTFGNMLTENGELKYYFGEGRMTDDPIDEAFFGCAGVAAIQNLQEVFIYIGRHGHRHHVNLTPGLHSEVMTEALGNYLKCEVVLPQTRKEPAHAAV